MARQIPNRTGGAGRGARAGKMARRAWPLVLTAVERWQALSPEEKERYKRRAREAADRGRRAVEQARARGGRRGPKRWS